ncbi:MAG: hypothetical protein R3244_03135 [Thermoanaerobaculia bacterium]|nr:hypothetical protein [Thermoanaerobaculia bacterium]
MPIARTALTPDQTLSRAPSLTDSHDAITRGIVHDLNNIFSSLEIATHLLQQDLSAERRQALLGSVSLATERGRHLADQLGRLNERAPAETVPLDVELLTEAVVRVAREQMVGSRSLQTEYDADLPPVAGDPDELFRLLLSLIEELVARTPEGGRVAIRGMARRATGDGGAEQPERVEIELEHSGTGASTRARTVWHQMTPDHLPVDADLAQVDENRWVVRLPVPECTGRSATDRGKVAATTTRPVLVSSSRSV